MQQNVPPNGEKPSKQGLEVNPRTHNPLVPGSSPGGPTNPAEFREFGGVFAFLDVLLGEAARVKAVFLAKSFDVHAGNLER